LIKNLAPEKIGHGGAVFNQENAYQPGQKKILQTENLIHSTKLSINPESTEGLIFGSAICVEIQYPWQIKDFKGMGAKFISHTTTNRWLVLGLKNYKELTNNIRRIEAVWLKIPIVVSAREEPAKIFLPTGNLELVNFENHNKNYGIFIGEVKLN
jgi:hypothetical protein